MTPRDDPSGRARAVSPHSSSATEPVAQDTTGPPLSADVSFWGMTVTQFLGAFNDNLFKQLVLLVSLDYLRAAGGNGTDVYQPIAAGLFALPFILFSGLAGFLSDRRSKRSVIVLSKIAEIAVMSAGLAVFWLQPPGSQGLLYMLLAVLFLMGMQSAFFGPSKYGILPEMLRGRDLPRANGIIQMTTFLAIIFGTAASGYAKDAFGQQLWMIGGICVAIALVGTTTSLLVGRTPVAQPGLRFRPSALAISSQTWRMLRGDRALFGVLMVSSLFWFIGGIVLPATNALGKVELNLGDARTSLLSACTGLGIAAGCVLAGKLSHEAVNFRLVRLGAWGIVLSLAATAVLPWMLGGANSSSESASRYAITDGTATTDIAASALAAPGPLEWSLRGALTLAGVSAGLFAVPLQVFLQARPPRDQKGRMIGAMNLVNWIGILLSAAAYFAFDALLMTLGLPRSGVFLLTAALMLPVALCYRPHDEALA